MFSEFRHSGGDAGWLPQLHRAGEGAGQSGGQVPPAQQDLLSRQHDREQGAYCHTNITWSNGGNQTLLSTLAEPEITPIDWANI